jgi:crotonobetainyl-CoA:carnitine CoA-transferase CaiB-like acyl-CoA transferase
MTAAAIGALRGIRVVDFTSMIAGPYCSRLLADCGAEVVKIEEPGGDHMRKGRPQRDGHSAYFASLNCGKKSCVIDLKSAEGRAVAADLAAASDIVLENYRPGVMGRLGLSYETLAARKRELVYCSISGFGQTGPRATQPAYAPVVHAASGFDHTQFVYQGGRDRDLRRRCAGSRLRLRSHPDRARRTPAAWPRPAHRRGTDGRHDRASRL